MGAWRPSEAIPARYPILSFLDRHVHTAQFWVPIHASVAPLSRLGLAGLAGMVYRPVQGLHQSQREKGLSIPCRLPGFS